MGGDVCCLPDCVLTDFLNKTSWRLSSDGRRESTLHGLSAEYRTPI